MSKQAETLYHGITGIRDDLIEQAEHYSSQRTILPWRRWATLAACALVILGIGTMFFLQRDFGSTASTGHGDGVVIPTAPENSTSTAEGASLLSYGGVILPLNALENGDSFTARRELTFDFQLFGSQEEPEAWYSKQLTSRNVRDSYTLTNETREEQAVTLCYPYIGSLSDVQNRLPSLTVNGGNVETQLYAGSHAGGADGEASLNLRDFSTWEQYQSLLADGSYLENAMSPSPTLSQPVIVYELSGETGDISQWPAATLSMSYTLEDEETQILTWGFNGYYLDDEASQRRSSYFLSQNEETISQTPHYFIVSGKDISSYSLQGYEDGGCAPGTEIQVTAQVNRYETTLDEILQTILPLHLEQIENEGEPESLLSLLSREELVALCGALLPVNSPGMLEDMISEVLYQKRIFYQTLTITVPAGDSVEIQAEMYKDSSMYYSHSESTSTSDYEVVTTLGSSLKFTAQTAALTNAGGVEILRQNFGFALEDGKAAVSLDLSQEHYYLDVAPLPSGQ